MFTETPEKHIGIETFLTPHTGINGKLRTLSEDFIVQEQFDKSLEYTNGVFTIAQITNKNWDTHRLVNELAKKLKISKKRIGFAGTKDKRAVTTQLLSFYEVTKQQLENIHLRDISIQEIKTTNTGLKLGDLTGNHFHIIIRNITQIITQNKIQEIIDYITSYGGFPNFYGVQRFGVIRPITHLIGKHVIMGNFQKAVMTYLCYCDPNEKPEILSLRSSLQKTQDFNEALKTFPDSLYYEKILLNKLVQNPRSYVEALKALPKNLLTMFINAYQSYLFNKILSLRMKKNIPLNNALVGDIILPKYNNTVEMRSIPVSDSNVDKINKQITRNKAVISGLLLGAKSIFAEGEIAEIEKQIITQEHIKLQDFIIPEIPYMSSWGSRRALLATVEKPEILIDKDELNPGKNAVHLSFTLQKGCYATCFLRELMKAEDILNY